MIDRDQLIKFCIEATAFLHGIHEDEIDGTEFVNMTDEELEREADWLDDMLGK